MFQLKNHLLITKLHACDFDLASLNVLDYLTYRKQRNKVESSIIHEKTSYQGQRKDLF